MGLSPFPNEQSVLRSIASGDQQAFRQVYDYFYQSMYRYALHLLKSETLAEEVVQETFLKIWIKREKLGEILNIEAYMVTIARNRCLDILRKTTLGYKHEQELKYTFIDSSNITEEQILMNDARKIIAEAIAALPPQQRQVYEYCKQEGLKYDEVAKLMGLSSYTVQSYMKIALRSVRNYLKDNSDLLIAALILRLL